MRLHRAVSTALAALAFGAASLFGTSASHAAAETYVALGDSYSSGTGAGNYTNVLCTRSANAYPQRWAAANSPAAFRFVACGGAKIPDVRNNQLSALDGSTTLVSITIGGNDVGFADTMLNCLLSTTTACRNAVNKGLEYAQNVLPGELDALYAEIRARAPQAKVVVLGYPRLYKDGGICLGGPSATKRSIINGGADRLNEVIAARAAAAGFTFADARAAFAGHEICTSAPWISGATVHPTATGHARGYLPALSAALTL
ncbi:SGNH family lipase [Planomonospora alba]|uniref:SGNH family lipase n=1 Tax=Planomonospora alba TaxID=161354 RepID=A0ABP6N6V8_9ACTN